MKNSTNKQTQSSHELPKLLDYWWQKREEEGKEIEEMMKHPMSVQQMKEQTQRNKMMLRKNNRENPVISPKDLGNSLG